MDKDELIRCMEDKVYFFEKYCKIPCYRSGIADITLYEYQKDLINEQYVQAETARQVGFTTLAVLNAFHDIVFKTEQTIAFAAPTLTQARRFRDLLLFLLANTTFPKEYLPVVRINNKQSTEFDNWNRVLYTSISCSHIRGFTLNSIYIEEVDYVSESQFKEYMYCCMPTIMSSKSAKFWIWSLNNNGNITTKYSDRFKVVKLPFWIIKDESYMRYKELVRILGEEQAKKEFGIT